MSIKRRNYTLTNQRDLRQLKALFGFWSFGIIVVLCGLYFFPDSMVLGIVLIAMALIVVPFLISGFLKK